MTDLASVFRRVHRRLKPRSPLPEIATEFYPSVGANHSATLENEHLKVRVSDLFVDAPEEVCEALAGILLAKLYRRKVDPEHHLVYRRYTLSPSMLERGRQVRAERGRQSRKPGPRGRVYDLDTIFRSVNRTYFRNNLRKPELSWTSRQARSILGRYDFDGDVIFISRFLDSPAVPEHVVQYIVFHEMLHVKHGSQVRNSREIVHPPAFRREEQQFEFFDAANAWLESH